MRPPDNKKAADQAAFSNSDYGTGQRSKANTNVPPHQALAALVRRGPAPGQQQQLRRRGRR
jgi:hypothetical protein